MYLLRSLDLLEIYTIIFSIHFTIAQLRPPVIGKDLLKTSPEVKSFRTIMASRKGNNSVAGSTQHFET